MVLRVVGMRGWSVLKSVPLNSPTTDLVPTLSNATEQLCRAPPSIAAEAHLPNPPCPSPPRPVTEEPPCSGLRRSRPNHGPPPVRFRPHAIQQGQCARVPSFPPKVTAWRFTVSPLLPASTLLIMHYFQGIRFYVLRAICVRELKI